MAEGHLRDSRRCHSAPGAPGRHARPGRSSILDLQGRPQVWQATSFSVAGPYSVAPAADTVSRGQHDRATAAFRTNPGGLGRRSSHVSEHHDGVSVPDAGHLGKDDLDRLLAAAARGEHGAFDLVYEQLSGPIYGVIRNVVRDPGLAEEVAQEVLLEIWRTSFRYDPAKGSAAGWALTIARRRAIDRVRSSAAATARERRTAFGPASWDQVGEAVAETADHARLRRCLDGLSVLQREAIMLAFYSGHTYVEVASLLGIPVGTAKARIRDALIRLRDCLQPPR